MTTGYMDVCMLVFVCTDLDIVMFILYFYIISGRVVPHDKYKEYKS